MDHKKILLSALAGEKTQRIPFWFMRQAGRYLPEYRELRAKSGGFLKMVYQPKTACEITMQPLRRFDMDAAIIFSDILVIPQALGQKLEFVEGEGPKLEAISKPAQISNLNFKNFDQILSPVYEALSLTRRAIQDGGFSDTTLIGFCGAPWTLAAYMIEGGGSDDFQKVRDFAAQNESDFSALIDVLIEADILYLSKQIDAGAEVLQIFDSHAGVLDDVGFKKWVIEPTKKITAALKKRYPHIPVIGFPRRTGNNYELYAKESGVSAMGLDQSVDIRWAARYLQNLLPVQGNLDPEILVNGGDNLEKQTYRILNDLSPKPFIFNLGHGVIKETPVSHVETLVKILKEYKRQ